MRFFNFHIALIRRTDLMLCSCSMECPRVLSSCKEPGLIPENERKGSSSESGREEVYGFKRIELWGDTSGRVDGLGIVISESVCCDFLLCGKKASNSPSSSYPRHCHPKLIHLSLRLCSLCVSLEQLLPTFKSGFHSVHRTVGLHKEQ